MRCPARTGSRSNRNLGKHRLGLGKDAANRSVLQVRRIAVLPQDAFHKKPKAGPGAVAMSPINADIGFETLQKLVGDDFKLIIAKDRNGAEVIGQRVVKSDFLRAQSGFFATAPSIAKFFCKLDKFLQYFHGADGIRVIARDRIFKPLGNQLIV